MFKFKKYVKIEKSKIDFITKFFDSFGHYNHGDAPQQNYTDYIYDKVNIKECMLIYEKVSPYRHIVDKIANSCSQIPIRIKINNNEVDNHYSLDLIKNPNYIENSSQFLKKLFIQYLVTGNAFISFSNDFRPTGINILEAYYFSYNTALMNDINQLPLSYSYNSNNYHNIYNLNTEDYIYRSNLQQALLPIKDFNSMIGNKVLGVPKTFSLLSELKQFVSGNLNNLATLENGGRPSMAWVNTRQEELTQDQFDRLVQEAKKYSGSKNSGKTPILDGVDIKPINQSNNDMQYQQLRNEIKKEIANCFGYPLQLLVDGSMTYNNMTIAMAQYYNNAVIPVWKDVMCQLSKFLSKIYKQDIEIYFNHNDIDSLRYSNLEEAKLKSSIGASTINEIREDIGDDPIDEGDVLLVPSTSTTLNNLENQQIPNNEIKFTELKNEYLKGI